MPVCASCGRESEGDFAFCPYCGAALFAKPSTAREQRKIVTVVFCDVAGSTSLGESVDPEALRSILHRYFERIKAIVEGHGGTVEKFVGDAVMAVFGVPVLHEDDALRAVRAASEILAALPELGVQARIGVDTGEVVTGTEERLATGDAVNVASRLEKAAAPGTVLLGEETAARTAGTTFGTESSSKREPTIVATTTENPDARLALMPGRIRGPLRRYSSACPAPRATAAGGAPWRRSSG